MEIMSVFFCSFYPDSDFLTPVLLGRISRPSLVERICSVVMAIVCLLSRSLGVNLELNHPCEDFGKFPAS